MTYYVIGGFDGPVNKCKSLSEAETLATELNHAIHEIEVTHPFGDKPPGCKLPVEIFTEEEWVNARRCD